MPNEYLELLEIQGFRGFAEKETLRPAIPDGTSGSGLTTIVGANNVGKSTIIEALTAIRSTPEPSFSQGRRNQKAGDKIYIRIAAQNGHEKVLTSIRPGSSETIYASGQNSFDTKRLLTLPSRRVFPVHFGKNEYDRVMYQYRTPLPNQRASLVDAFTGRLQKIYRDPEKFNQELAKVLGYSLNWTIDSNDQGNYFLKIIKEDSSHSSEGLGEGITSLLYIIDALYESKKGDIIAIDEPELSLHPSLQRRLLQLFLEYAKDRQIIISTHSPYFISFDAIKNGGALARIHQKQGSIRISNLPTNIAKEVSERLKNNRNNPHILGLNACEVFFSEDGIILVEGQEDVIYYKIVQQSIGVELRGTFFGWGVGGAGNMRLMANLFKELGYPKLVGILDKDKEEEVVKLKQEFGCYHFFAIPANDVRTKKVNGNTKEGLLNNSNEEVRDKYKEETMQLFTKANSYLSDSDPPTA